jgi:hypothetical protein
MEPRNGSINFVRIRTLHRRGLKADRFNTNRIRVSLGLGFMDQSSLG